MVIDKNFKKPKKIVLTLLAITVVLLQGCSSSEVISNEFYVLGSSNNSRLAMVSGKPVMSIRSVRLPKYLKKKGVARNIGDGKIQVSFKDQWAESLSESIPSFLTKELEVELQKPVVRHPLSPGHTVDVILEIDISKFVSYENNLVLEAKYRLIKQNELVVNNFLTTIKLDDKNTFGVVKAHEAALQKLAQDIAEKF